MKKTNAKFNQRPKPKKHVNPIPTADRPDADNMFYNPFLGGEDVHVHRTQRGRYVGASVTLGDGCSMARCYTY